jgi:hypothetical protein
MTTVFSFLKITQTLKDYEGFDGYEEVLKERMDEIRRKAWI